MIEGGPLVSICIPTYQQTFHLKKNLDSILLQSFKDYEIVITDDTPNEEVYNLLQSYNDLFSGKLKYYKNAVPLGSPENWNESIRKSNGKFIKILHHDDWFNTRESLEKFVTKLEENLDIGVVVSSAVAVQNNGSSKPFTLDLQKIKVLEVNPYKLFFGNFIGPPSSLMFRKECFAPFDTNLKWVVDIDFYIRVLSAGHRLGVIEEELIAVSVEGDFKVTNDCIDDINIVLGEQIYLFNKIKKFIKSDKRRYIKYIHEIMGQFKIKSFNQLQESNYSGVTLDISKSDRILLSVSEFTPSRILRYFNSKRKSIITSATNLLPNKSNKHAKISYSQCGEDLLVEFVLMQLRVENMSYLDIGAHHPEYINNTYLFYSQGSRGVSIEPDPELFKNFLTRRSEDTNLNIGINDKAYEFKSMQDFFIMSERSLNTFSLSEANDVEASTNYKIEKTVSIPTQDINSILETYFHSKNLDLLSIDTEGLDFLILQALDFNKYSPKILCVETLTFSAAGKEKKRTDLIDFIISKGYFVYADTYINTIFVNNEIWNTR